MIININNFLKKERPYWNELESLMTKIENEPGYILSFEEVEKLYYLYKRTTSDLVKLRTFAAAPEINLYLETLISRSFAEINKSGGRKKTFSFKQWFFYILPQTFRKHIAAFILSFLIMFAGTLFGGISVMVDPAAKNIIIPFQQLSESPGERVTREENSSSDRLAGKKSTFSAFLMSNNIRVSILVFALGITWGIGSVIILFYNGVILGAVIFDYIIAGKSTFLTGWLLPHGAFEITAILISGQAAFVLADSLIGFKKQFPFKERMRKISNSVITLISGVALMLVWAGMVEAFLSQYHEPVIPYSLKIMFGIVELLILFIFFSFSGKVKNKKTEKFE